MNRAADVALASLGLVVDEPADRGRPRSRSSSRTAGRCSTGSAGSARTAIEFELLKLRTMVVGAEKQGAGFAVDQGDPRITRAGRILRAALDRRAAAALERRPRRHERDRAAADAPLPGRAVHAAAAAPARGQARDHRLGAGPRPRGAALGGADRARRLVRRAPLAAGSTWRSSRGRRSRSSAARTRARPAAGVRAARSEATLCRRDRRPLHLRRPARRHRLRVPPRGRAHGRGRREPARAGALPRGRARDRAAGRRSRLPRRARRSSSASTTCG